MRAQLPSDDPRRGILRNRAIEDNLPMARRLARRYDGRGEPSDDLAQVAVLGLIRAVDGFDPQRAVSFTNYAVPTIIGTLKRHFRDTTWAMRVPRSTQQLAADIRTVTGELEQLHSRTPTSAELAAHLDVDVDAITDAVDASHAYRLLSLNAPFSRFAAGEVGDLAGRIDPRIGAVDDRLSLEPLRRLLAALSPREQRILTLRFTEEWTQSSIAADLGVSQMHVSRLLKRALGHLRTDLLAAAGHHADEDPA